MVAYLNATINRKTRNAEPDIGSDKFSQTRQKPQFDGCRSGIAPPRLRGSGFWTGLEPTDLRLKAKHGPLAGYPDPLLTLAVVMNTEGFGESWNLSCISVRSSLPISAYM